MNSNKQEIVKGITLSQLNTWLSTDRSEYTKAHRRIKRLDALDKNKLWESLKAKFPAYQLLPQTNHVSYIKNNILASIYTVGKSAELRCTSARDKDICTQLNVALEHIWDSRNVAKYMLEAGERAALCNLGITQVGWDNSIISGGFDNFEKGQVTLKNIDPLKYYRDPYADCLDNASHVVVWDDYHASVIKANPMYAKEFKAFLQAKENGTVPTETLAYTDKVSPTAANRKDYYRVYCWYVKTEKGITEIHTVNNKHVLYKRENIQPSCYPFAELYCNLPAGDLIGTSEPAKIADNSIVYNIMQSIVATGEYKNQRPPRFISDSSGINVNAFVRHGNDADRTFIVQGDASKAVHYHQFPTASPQCTQNMQTLSNDIQLITGVDGRYTGRDTGSVITTGGVNSMLEQVTLIDTTKILLYEDYAKRLSKLIIYNYLQNSALDRTYLVKSKTHIDSYDMVTVPFTQIDPNIVFEYDIDISSEMPKNKQRLADTANNMIEKQMQYQGAGLDVDLITPQEWLMFQDIPNKEYFLERMNVQRTDNWNNIVAQVVTQYAAQVDQGMSPEDSINLTAQTMAQSGQPGGADMESIAQDFNMMGGM